MAEPSPSIRKATKSAIEQIDSAVKDLMPLISFENGRPGSRALARIEDVIFSLEVSKRDLKHVIAGRI